MRRTGWWIGFWVASCGMCGLASAQQSCPWLTQGTAASLLGGTVTASVHVASGEGSCDFAREDRSSRLQIVVGHHPSNECPKGEPLAGIGQESVLCVEDAAGEHRETIRGHVRSSHFLLTLTAHAASALLRSSLEQAGEEVAGNLF
jgi:hypothetical protein